MLIMKGKPTSQDIRAYLRMAVDGSGVDATHLAARAGLRQSTITRSLQADYTGIMRPATLTAIEAASGVPLTPLLAEYVASSAIQTRPSLREERSTFEHAPAVDQHDGIPLDRLRVRPGAELVGDRDLPVYASAEGGPTGMTVTYEPIEYVKRPEPLMNVRGAFGFYVVGDSMFPKFRAGDLLLVHPTRPPQRADHVLVMLHDGIDESAIQALVKVYMGWTGERLHLEQYNPAGAIPPIPRAKVKGVHKIVGSYERA